MFIWTESEESFFFIRARKQGVAFSSVHFAECVSLLSFSFLGQSSLYFLCGDFVFIVVCVCDCILDGLLLIVQVFGLGVGV